MCILFAQQSPTNNLPQTLITACVIMLLFYFLLLRPEQKRRKHLENQRAALKKGDQISAFGIIGNIESIKSDTVIIKTADSKIEVAKQSITEVRKRSTEEKANASNA